MLDQFLSFEGALTADDLM